MQQQTFYCVALSHGIRPSHIMDHLRKSVRSFHRKVVFQPKPLLPRLFFCSERVHICAFQRTCTDTTEAFKRFFLDSVPSHSEFCDVQRDGQKRKNGKVGAGGEWDEWSLLLVCSRGYFGKHTSRLTCSSFCANGLLYGFLESIVSLGKHFDEGHIGTRL